MALYSAGRVSLLCIVTVTRTRTQDCALEHGVAPAPACEQRISATCLVTGATMSEQSQLPLVGPPKRRGWREIVWFRPLTASTHAARVVTRRGRLVSILPAGGPRALSDYLAW